MISTCALSPLAAHLFNAANYVIANLKTKCRVALNRRSNSFPPHRVVYQNRIGPDEFSTIHKKSKPQQPQIDKKNSCHSHSICQPICHNNLSHQQIEAIPAVLLLPIDIDTNASVMYAELTVLPPPRTHTQRFGNASLAPG